MQVLQRLGGYDLEARGVREVKVRTPSVLVVAGQHCGLVDCQLTAVSCCVGQGTNDDLLAQWQGRL